MDITQKWADDMSDIAVTEQDTVDPPQELANTGKEWPTLIPYDDTRRDTKTMPTHQDTNNKDGSERRPLVNRPTSSDTTALMDKAGSGSTRIKKQRLDKSSEHLNDRKRTRNRAQRPPKTNTDFLLLNCPHSDRHSHNCHAKHQRPGYCHPYSNAGVHTNERD
jgi:hypothetical protein